MKALSNKNISNILVILACACFLIISGCENKDPQKAVSETVKTLMSGEAIKKSEQMKKDLDQAVQEETKRLLKMDKNTSGDASKEDSGKEAEKESDK